MFRGIKQNPEKQSPVSVIDFSGLRGQKFRGIIFRRWMVRWEKSRARIAENKSIHFATRFLIHMKRFNLIGCGWKLVSIYSLITMRCLRNIHFKVTVSATKWIFLKSLYLRFKSSKNSWKCMSFEKDWKIFCNNLWIVQIFSKFLFLLVKRFIKYKKVLGTG